MSNFKNVFLLVFCLVFVFAACGGEKPQPQPAEDVADTSPAVAEVEKAEPAVMNTAAGIETIGTYSELWNQLYNENEAVINGYEGMPIMGLVTPQLTFVTSVQYDMLNTDGQEGRFEGKLLLAGFDGFVEKSGSLIRFGYENTLEKDGFGPSAKVGDKSVQTGFLDLDKAYYRAEVIKERAGKRISRSYTEFKRLADGSMICIDFNGNLFDMRGNEDKNDQVIFLHNGPGRYDFVIAKGKNGPEYTALSFEDKGDLTKEQAISLFVEAGYTLDKVGGIKDGKLVLDPQ